MSTIGPQLPEPSAGLRSQIQAKASKFVKLYNKAVEELKMQHAAFEQKYHVVIPFSDEIDAATITKLAHEQLGVLSPQAEKELTSDAQRLVTAFKTNLVIPNQVKTNIEKEYHITIAGPANADKITDLAMEQLGLNRQGDQRSSSTYDRLTAAARQDNPDFQKVERDILAETNLISAEFSYVPGIDTLMNYMRQVRTFSAAAATNLMSPLHISPFLIAKTFDNLAKFACLLVGSLPFTALFLVGTPLNALSKLAYQLMDTLGQTVADVKRSLSKNPRLQKILQKTAESVNEKNVELTAWKEKGPLAKTFSHDELGLTESGERKNATHYQKTVDHARNTHPGFRTLQREILGDASHLQQTFNSVPGIEMLTTALQRARTYVAALGSSLDRKDSAIMARTADILVTGAIVLTTALPFQLLVVASALGKGVKSLYTAAIKESKKILKQLQEEIHSFMTGIKFNPEADKIFNEMLAKVKAAQVEVDEEASQNEPLML